jgi:hypothetical protein
MIKLTPKLAKLSNAELARRFGVTPTAIVFARRKAMGLCTVCASPAVEGRRFCTDCQVARRTYMRNRDRKRYGWKPWEPGKKGRPPIEITESQRRDRQ